jgi:hypothetical protein
MAPEMTFRSETHTADNGATVETGTVEVSGRAFTALGSVVDPARGLIVGYVREVKDPSRALGVRFELTTWQGALIAPLKLVRTFESYGVARCRMRAWSATIDGRVYSGRNSGAGMLVRMRAGRTVK